jgi:hypothetical protein
MLEMTAMDAAHESDGATFGSADDADDRAADPDGRRGRVQGLVPRLLIENRRLIGYYEALDSLMVPVLDSHDEVFSELFRLVGAGKPWNRPELCADTPLPWPTQYHLDALAAFVSLCGEPKLVSIVYVAAPARCAQALQDGTPRSEAERDVLIADAYEDPYARAVYSTLDLFNEAVVRAERELLASRRRPERPTIQLSTREVAHLPFAPRDLEAILDHVMDEARRRLPRVRIPVLTRPKVQWTDNVTKSFFADWTSGERPGQQVIRVNVLFSAPSECVSDAFLAFLLWHEVLHGVTPGQGHDAEFDELETRWPNWPECDSDMDSIPDRWSMERAHYPDRGAKAQDAANRYRESRGPGLPALGT